MKLLKGILVSVAAFNFGAIYTSVQPKTTNAVSIYNEANKVWRHPQWVTFTKNTSITKMHRVYPLYKSYSVKNYTIKKWSHYKLGHWGSNWSWTLESGKFNSHSASGKGKYVYVVNKPHNSHSWFRFGIYEKPNFKNSKNNGNIKIAKSINFSTTSWEYGFLNPDYPSAQLYKTYKDADNGSPVAKTINDPTTVLKVKRVKGLIYQVRYKGHMYFANNLFSKDILPYNATIYSQVMLESYFSPKSKYATIRHGSRIKHESTWEYKKSKHTTIVYSYDKGSWKYWYTRHE